MLIGTSLECINWYINVSLKNLVQGGKYCTFMIAFYILHYAKGTFLADALFVC